MGATILRWFWRDGVRHHAYFRSVGDSGRELVVASGSRSHAVPAAADMSLDELPEEQLAALAAELDAQPAVPLIVETPTGTPAGR